MFGIFNKKPKRKRLKPVEYSDWFKEACEKHGQYRFRIENSELLQVFDAISRTIGEEHVDGARILFFEEPYLAMESLTSCVIHTNTAIQNEDFKLLKGWFQKNGYDPRFEERTIRDLEFIEKNLICPIDEP